jgi:hypothetical protein
MASARVPLAQICPPNAAKRPISGADLTFTTPSTAGSQANVKSKAPLESIFSSGPSIPTFAKWCPLKWDANVGIGTTGAVTGSLVESQYSPFSANRLPRWIATNIALRWPGSFGFGFLSPQPPGIVGTGPSAAKKGQLTLALFCLRMPLGRRRRRESATARSAHAIRITPDDFQKRISAARCRPRPAWDRACRDCRPGPAPRRRRRHHAPGCRAISSSFQALRSSHRPSRGYAPHCGR